MFVLKVLIVCVLLVFSSLNPVHAQRAEPGEMYFAVAEWAYEVWDEDDYDLNQTGAFPKGERAYAYLELAGFSTVQSNGAYAYHVSVDVGLETTWGLGLFKQADLVEFDSLALDPPSTLWFYIWVDIPRWAPSGTYVTVITVLDQISGHILQEKRKIRIF